MFDAFHWWEGDLSLAPDGDIMVVNGLDADNQAIVRRICTPGSQSGALIADYFFHPTYGGAAPWYVGRTDDGLTLQGVIRFQMYEEQSVSHLPEPEIDIQFGALGTYSVQVKYFDAETGSALPPLVFDVS